MVFVALCLKYKAQKTSLHTLRTEAKGYPVYYFRYFHDQSHCPGFFVPLCISLFMD